MIIHVVSFQFKSGCSWDDPRARDAELITCGHPVRVPGILRWTVGRNISCRDVAYDFGLVAEFADTDSLRRFLDHPDHQRGVRAWQEISSWVVVDIESGPAVGDQARRLAAEPAPERCAVVVCDALSAGHAANAAAAVTAMLAVRTPGLLGPDVRDADGVVHAGVVLVPVPVLVAPVDRIAQLWRAGTGDPALVCAGFTAQAQSCRTYQEYLELMAVAPTDDLQFVAVGLAGAKRPVNRLTGSLPLLR